MDEKEVQVDEVSLEDTQTETDVAETTVEAATNNEIEQLNAQIADLNDKYLRAPPNARPMS